ncbi:MAG: ubiquitin carboxyl-terminal hydrolase 14 [Gemmatimonadaceae bacterium]
MKKCSHLNLIQDVDPRTPEGCEECLELGMEWVHLRLCMTCGHVGCCDNSIGKHATKHFHASNHPLIRSFQPGEDWAWCYIDELAIEPAPSVQRRS